MRSPAARWAALARLSIVGACVALAGSARPLDAQALLTSGERSFVSPSGGAGRFPLATPGRAAPLFVSPSDYAGVMRAAGDLRADIARVTGTRPALDVGEAPQGDAVVLIGTLGRSPLIDRLVRAGKLDVGDIAGRWESYRIQALRNPLPSVPRALVIAGSDQRGTIYGIYDISRQIGVSPWYWWADVPTYHHDSLFVLPGRHGSGPPAVKYRGIFINDEAPALSSWAREKFGGFNHEFYARVFELILRLRGNYLWPAMWESAFAVDDTLDPRLAAEYGIVMGTSHHEPMTRAQAEWHLFGNGPWNYQTNDSTLRAFWRAGIQRMDSRENIVTIGMRGDGDLPMTEGSNIALLERIVSDQRRVIAEVTHEPPSATPQLWALYKEVQDYYDRGMRVPDDVTLLFSDDNWGDIRRLPAAGDTVRAGGFGIYYHFDYVGGPRNYKWINTNSLPRVWEQMHLAHSYGANRIWIVNVGDIKPMELPTQFFLDYAWNPDAWPAEMLPEYMRRWAGELFGMEHAQAIARIVAEYTKFNARRKPELLSPDTYSLLHYREAEKVVAAYDSLADAARALYRGLPPVQRAAFYELVLHPVEASANLNALYVTVAKNRRYALEERAATNAMADRARRLFERDAEISRYYNDTLAGGKWHHMMDQTHIGYTSWQEPPRNVMPRVDVIQVPVAADMGIDVEGSAGSGALGARLAPSSRHGPPQPTLPMFDAYQRQREYIDVYNRGQTPFTFTVDAGAPWLHVVPSRDSVAIQERLWVSVDWDRAPAGTVRVPITVTGSEGHRYVVQAVVRNPSSPFRDHVSGFVEGDGYLAMEAEHYTAAFARAPLHWQRVPDLGRTLSGMTVFPVTAPSQDPARDGPRLEYRVFLFDSGAVTVRAYLSPTLDFTNRREGLRYAISFDDQPPQIVKITADSSNAAWESSVASAINIQTTRHVLSHPGSHVLSFWMVDPGVVLQRLVIDAGGVQPSYLGPPESFHGAAVAPAAAASTGTGRRR